MNNASELLRQLQELAEKRQSLTTLNQELKQLEHTLESLSGRSAAFSSTLKQLAETQQQARQLRGEYQALQQKILQTPRVLEQVRQAQQRLNQAAPRKTTTAYRDLQFNLEAVQRELAELSAQQAAATLAFKREEVAKTQVQATESQKRQNLLQTEVQQERRLRREHQREVQDAAVSVSETLSGVFQVNTRAELRESRNRQQARRQELEALRTQAEQAEGLEKRRLERKAKVKARQLREEEKRQKAAAQRGQRIQLSQAIVAGARAVANAIASPPFFPANLPTVIATTAAQAAQVATISAQKFTRGGLLRGPRHEQGGVLARVGGVQPVELEGGEAVINRKSTARYQELLSAINQMERRSGVRVHAQHRNRRPRHPNRSTSAASCPGAGYRARGERHSGTPQQSGRYPAPGVGQRVAGGQPAGGGA